MTEHGIDDLLYFGEQAVASGQLSSFTIAIEAYAYPDDPSTIEHRDVEISLRRAAEWRVKIFSVGLEDWRDDKRRAAFLERAMPQMQRFVETGE